MNANTSPFSSSFLPELLAHELDIGENVQWIGQPDPKRLFVRALPQSFFSLLLLAFSLFWMWGASATLRATLAAGATPSLGDVLFPSFGMFFAVMGVLGVASPWIERAKAPRTVYALTDRRALIVVSGLSGKRTVKSVSPAEFSLSQRDASDGKRDLVLKREEGSGRQKTIVEVGFFGIPDARD